MGRHPSALVAPARSGYCHQLQRFCWTPKATTCPKTWRQPTSPGQAAAPFPASSPHLPSAPRKKDKLGPSSPDPAVKKHSHTLSKSLSQRTGTEAPAANTPNLPKTGKNQDSLNSHIPCTPSCASPRGRPEPGRGTLPSRRADLLLLAGNSLISPGWS